MTVASFRKLVEDCRQWVDDCWDEYDLAEAQEIAQSLIERFKGRWPELEEARREAEEYERQEQEAAEDDYDMGPPPEGTYPNPQMIRDSSWGEDKGHGPEAQGEDPYLDSFLEGVDHDAERRNIDDNADSH